MQLIIALLFLLLTTGAQANHGGPDLNNDINIPGSVPVQSPPTMWVCGEGKIVKASLLGAGYVPDFIGVMSGDDSTAIVKWKYLGKVKNPDIDSIMTMNTTGGGICITNVFSATDTMEPKAPVIPDDSF